MSALTEAHAGPSSLARVGLPHAPLPSWLLFCLQLLVVLPVVQLSLLGNYSFGWVLVELELPRLESQLGFTLGRVFTTGPCGTTHSDAVIAVGPGGAFDRAGVRPGDLLFGYKHGFRADLAFDLLSHRGQTVELHFLRMGRGEVGERVVAWVQVAGE